MPTFVITSHFPQRFSTFSRGSHSKCKNANLNKNRINTFVFINYLIWQYLYLNVRVLQYYTLNLDKFKTIGIFENFIIIWQYRYDICVLNPGRENPTQLQVNFTLIHICKS